MGLSAGALAYLAALVALSAWFGYRIARVAGPWPLWPEALSLNSCALATALLFAAFVASLLLDMYMVAAVEGACFCVFASVYASVRYRTRHWWREQRRRRKAAVQPSLEDVAPPAPAAAPAVATPPPLPLFSERELPPTARPPPAPPPPPLTPRHAAREHARERGERRAALRERLQLRHVGVKQALRGEVASRHADARAAAEEKREEWRARRALRQAAAEASCASSPSSCVAPSRAHAADGGPCAAVPALHQSYHRAVSFWKEETRPRRAEAKAKRGEAAAPPRTSKRASEPVSERDVSRAKLARAEHASGGGDPLEASHAATPRPQLTRPRLRPLLHYWKEEERLHAPEGASEAKSGARPRPTWHEQRRCSGPSAGAGGESRRHRDQRLADERSRRQALLDQMAERRQTRLVQLGAGASGPSAVPSLAPPLRSSREFGAFTRRGLKDAPSRWYAPRAAHAHAPRARSAAAGQPAARRGHSGVAAANGRPVERPEALARVAWPSWVPWLGGGEGLSIGGPEPGPRGAGVGGGGDGGGGGGGGSGGAGTGGGAGGGGGWRSWWMPWAERPLSPHSQQVADLGAALGAVGLGVVAQDARETVEDASARRARKLQESRARAAERAQHRHDIEHVQHEHDDEAIHAKQRALILATQVAAATKLQRNARGYVVRTRVRRQLRQAQETREQHAKEKAARERRKLEESRARAIARAEMRREPTTIKKVGANKPKGEEVESWWDALFRT